MVPHVLSTYYACIRMLDKAVPPKSVLWWGVYGMGEYCKKNICQYLISLKEISHFNTLMFLKKCVTGSVTLCLVGSDMGDCQWGTETRFMFHSVILAFLVKTNILGRFHLSLCPQSSTDSTLKMIPVTSSAETCAN